MRRLRHWRTGSYATTGSEHGCSCWNYCVAAGAALLQLQVKAAVLACVAELANEVGIGLAVRSARVYVG